LDVFFGFGCFCMCPVCGLLFEFGSGECSIVVHLHAGAVAQFARWLFSASGAVAVLEVEVDNGGLIDVGVVGMEVQ
jgi:hypothetical protein